MYRTERLEASINIASYIDGYVDVERFLACCRECPNYGQLWSCPPYDFDPLDIWRAFDTLTVLAYRVTWSRAYTEGEMDMVHDRIKQKIADDVDRNRADNQEYQQNNGQNLFRHHERILLT